MGSWGPVVGTGPLPMVPEERNGEAQGRQPGPGGLHKQEGLWLVACGLCRALEVLLSQEAEGRPGPVLCLPHCF